MQKFKTKQNLKQAYIKKLDTKKYFTNLPKKKTCDKYQNRSNQSGVNPEIIIT